MDDDSLIEFLSNYNLTNHQMILELFQLDVITISLSAKVKAVITSCPIISTLDFPFVCSIYDVLIHLLKWEVCFSG